MMIAGIVFILMGVLIAAYPELLSLIIAAMLIFLGVTFISLSLYYKRMSRKFNDPFMNFFFRI
jgi:drug/metabolite transporter (DMT)-like permease